MKTLDLVKIACQLGLDTDNIYTNNIIDRRKVLDKLHITSVRGPVNNREPLDTNDIYNAILPYQTKYPSFEFIGVFPIDISETYAALKNIDFAQMKGTNRKLSIVWNTDVATGKGKHWICMFIDFRSYSICYFDTINKDYDYRLQHTLHSIKSKYPDVKLYRNNKQIQDKKGNCGVYVIMFIVGQIIGDNTCNESYEGFENNCAENFGYNKIINNFRKLIFDVKK